MNRIRKLCKVLLVFMILSLTGSQTSAQQCKMESELIQKLSKSVVLVKSDYRGINRNNVFRDSNDNSKSGIVIVKTNYVYTFFTGSGFFISKDGEILTIDHNVRPVVIDRNVEYGLYAVTIFSGGTSYKATVIGVDPVAKTALLKIQPNGNESFPVLTFGDFSKLKIGDCVFTISDPFAQTNWFKTAVVSKIDKSGYGDDWSYSVNLIKTNMSVVGGDSGGPLFDQTGQVVGINESLFQGTTMSFSVAVDDLVQKSVNALLDRQSIERFTFNSKFRDMSRLNVNSDIHKQELLRASYGIAEDVNHGVMLEINHEPGFQDGDIITAINDKEIYDLGDFNTAIAMLPINQNAKITFLRKGVSTTLYTMFSIKTIIPIPR